MNNEDPEYAFWGTVGRFGDATDMFLGDPTFASECFQALMQGRLMQNTKVRRYMATLETEGAFALALLQQIEAFYKMTRSTHEVKVVDYGSFYMEDTVSFPKTLCDGLWAFAGVRVAWGTLAERGSGAAGFDAACRHVDDTIAYVNYRTNSTYALPVVEAWKEHKQLLSKLSEGPPPVARQVLDRYLQNSTTRMHAAVGALSYTDFVQSDWERRVLAYRHDKDVPLREGVLCSPTSGKPLLTERDLLLADCGPCPTGAAHWAMQGVDARLHGCWSTCTPAIEDAVDFWQRLGGLVRLKLGLRDPLPFPEGIPVAFWLFDECLDGAFVGKTFSEEERVKDDGSMWLGNIKGSIHILGRVNDVYVYENEERRRRCEVRVNDVHYYGYIRRGSVMWRGDRVVLTVGKSQEVMTPRALSCVLSKHGWAPLVGQATIGKPTHTFVAQPTVQTAVFTI